MNRQLFAILPAALLLVSACQADQVGSDITVSGTVLDQPFSASSGSAELANGTYVITLSDDPNFTCTTSPAGDYLSVDMFNVSGSGSYNAADNVTFSSNANQVLDQEAADSGVFDVTLATDTAGNSRLQGSINANGATSSINGTFDVPVCK